MKTIFHLIKSKTGRCFLHIFIYESWSEGLQRPRLPRQFISLNLNYFIVTWSAQHITFSLHRDQILVNSLLLQTILLLCLNKKFLTKFFVNFKILAAHFSLTLNKLIHRDYFKVRRGWGEQGPVEEGFPTGLRIFLFLLLDDWSLDQFE